MKLVVTSLLVLLSDYVTNGFTTNSRHMDTPFSIKILRPYHSIGTPTFQDEWNFELKSSNQNDDSNDSSISVLENYEDDEKPADVVGAQFFGGNTEKEDLYDPVAESEANIDDSTITSYERMKDPSTFPDDESRELVLRLQREIDVCLTGNNSKKGSEKYAPLYTKNTKWTSPIATDKTSNPMDEIQKALNFYKSIDIAIISAKSLSTNEAELRWEISVEWPNTWESRAILSGISTIVYDLTTFQIISQNDRLDNGGKDGNDIIGALKSQLNPRFWDLYHIGMSPSAQLTQKLPSSKEKKLFSQYNLYEIAPRLVYQPTLIDDGGRKMRAAQSLPNHAFTTIIKTMGPKKNKYVTTSPIEISIQKSEDKGKNLITWTVPLPPMFSKTLTLPIPKVEQDEMEIASCKYQYQPRRRVATLPYAGNAQDKDISVVRKKLYEAVVNDGLRPKIGKDGKPSFLFFQNDAKACFTEAGLGMAVYEWQPKFYEGNEVGIELML